MLAKGLCDLDPVYFLEGLEIFLLINKTDFSHVA